MTEVPPIYYDEVSICTHKQVGDEKSLEKILDEVKNINLPDGFKNRIVDIDSDNIYDSEIYFGESGSESPDEAENRILIDADKEDKNDLHIHFYFDDENVENVKNISSEIIDIIESTKVHILTGNIIGPFGFSNLELPVKRDSDQSANGVRFEYEDVTYLVQGFSENDPEEDDNPTYIRVSRREIEEDVTTGGTFIEECLEQIEKDISNIFKQ